MRLKLSFNALCIVVTLLFFRAAYAENIQKHAKISSALQELAQNVAVYVKNEPNTLDQIRVGGWEGPAGGGSGICQSLREHLDDQGVKLRDFGGYSVGGSYAQGKDEKDKHVTVITAVVRDATGNQTCEFKKRVVSDTQSAIELFGANVDLTAASDDDEKIILASHNIDPLTRTLHSRDQRDKIVRDRIASPQNNPTIFVSRPANDPIPQPINSIVKFSEDSLYGVELVTKDEHDPIDAPYTSSCDIDVNAGIPSTNIPHNKVYAIRVHNESEHEVAVSITIDGINIYAFSDNPHWKAQGQTVIRPGVGIIMGWPMEGLSVNEFTIVQYGESAANLLGGTNVTGLITVVFHPLGRAKGDVEDVPATGIGRKVDAGLHLTNAVFTSRILGALSIQYRRP